MDLTRACANILNQLSELTYRIRDQDFIQPVPSLSGSTIGQHLRHTLEFFLCFEKGFHEGVVNYDRRAHDKLIETDKLVAASAIERIGLFISHLQEKALQLEVGYDASGDSFVTVKTTAMRELVYNIEHAVHHMAIMKIGVREIAAYIELPAGFGIAASTIRYQDVVATR